MSEQDRVDSPEHDEVEVHKHHMTDDADSTTASDDFEAHGTGRNPQAWSDSDDVEAHGTGRNPQAAQEPGSEDSDDVEAHGTGRNPQAWQEPGSDDSDDVEAHGTGRNPQQSHPLLADLEKLRRARPSGLVAAE